MLSRTESSREGGCIGYQKLLNNTIGGDINLHQGTKYLPA